MTDAEEGPRKPDDNTLKGEYPEAQFQNGEGKAVVSEVRYCRRRGKKRGSTQIHPPVRKPRFGRGIWRFGGQGAQVSAGRSQKTGDTRQKE